MRKIESREISNRKNTFLKQYWFAVNGKPNTTNDIQTGKLLK